VLDEALCVRMIDRLSEGGEIHMATDVFELALDAMEHLEAAPRLHNLHEPWSFAREGPWPVCSRREVMTMRRRQRVWRLRYRLASTSASRSGK
jgi:tRNA (guanine-N7-)-methyltransferase